MRGIEWIRRHVFATACLAGLVAGSAIGLAQPIRASAPDPSELDQWKPYGEMELARFRQDRFSALRSARIWGDADAAGGPAARQWRLTGIILQPVPAALVVAEGGTDVQQLAVSAALPDGGRIIEVGSGWIRFTRAGCTYQRFLYAGIDPAEAGECDPGNTTPQAQYPEP